MEEAPTPTLCFTEPTHAAGAGTRRSDRRSAGEGIGECIANANVHPSEMDLVELAPCTEAFPLPRSERGLGWGQIALLTLAILTLCFPLSAFADAHPAKAPTATTQWIRGETQKLKSIPAGSFDSVLPATDETKRIDVKAFRLDATPVTNRELATFLANHPEWRRDRVARVFADEQYLQHWTSATSPAKEDLNKPAVHVSWFAASAYCESRGARLPTWHEWEYVAAASESKRDARGDPAWRQQILAWYSQSARKGLPDVGVTPANIYGIRDLHGVVWEWIEDLPALLVANDSREQGDPSELRFCGAGAVSMEQKENYAMLMRIAMLSSMKASYTSATMGFRCATDGESTR